jgi:hypothetical protein
VKYRSQYVVLVRLEKNWYWYLVRVLYGGNYKNPPTLVLLLWQFQFLSTVNTHPGANNKHTITATLPRYQNNERISENTSSSHS